MVAVGGVVGVDGGGGGDDDFGSLRCEMGADAGASIDFSQCLCYNYGNPAMAGWSFGGF